MKLKKLSLFAGAIAVAFSITPLVANAQAKPNNAPQTSQTRPQSGPELKLSQQQINKINQIRSSTRDKIQGVLTEKQRQQIQSDLQAGKPAPQVFAAIQFTQQQEAQLQQIMVGSQKEMEGVLDAQQKKILEAWRAAQRSQTQKK